MVPVREERLSVSLPSKADSFFPFQAGLVSTEALVDRGCSLSILSTETCVHQGQSNEQCRLRAT